MGLPLMPATVFVMSSRGLGVLMMMSGSPARNVLSTPMTSTSKRSGSVPLKTVRP
jgi:hypothetical protein